MKIKEIKTKFPDINLDDIIDNFPRIELSNYPELAHMTWEQCHQGAMGPGGLFLAVDIAKKLNLKPGQHVLDLGCGNANTTVFLAKQYGVKITAVDLWVNKEVIQKRIDNEGLSEKVNVRQGDFMELDFAAESFDAIFCMDALHYFSEKKNFPDKLGTLIKTNGLFSAGGPCYKSEIDDETPKEFLHDESHLYHYPEWWKGFIESGPFKTLTCEIHPLGRELWLDDVRFSFEEKHPKDRHDWTRECMLENIVMMLKDTKRFVTHYLLMAQKTT